MYHEHFGLKELPFGITPDTSYFFAHASHQEALNTLLVAVRSGEGFIKVVGEVGTGKTLLCRKFLGALPPAEFATAYIPNPYLQPMTLLLAIADEFGVNYPNPVTQHQLLRILTQFFIETQTQGKRVVVCLDEAQAMPIVTLESLRLLTNLETERRKLIQVVLFGQPELDVRLERASVRQLRQRITFSCRLKPFAFEDTEYYIAHRLSIAGHRGARLFAPDAVKRLHRAARGVPRLINILAHKAMIAAFGEGTDVVSDAHVQLAIADTESVAGDDRRAHTRLLRYAMVALATAGLAAGALVWASLA
jgi:MSHA biogenesis protein MshM